MVVRHKVLGVGPKHRLVLQDAEMDDTNKEDGKRKETDKRKSN